MAGMYVQDSPFYPVGYEQITLDAVTAKGFTTATLGDANFAVVKVQGNIRFRDDNTDPTAGVGMPWGVNDPILTVTLADMSKFKMISQSGAVVVDVLYYIR